LAQRPGPASGTGPVSPLWTLQDLTGLGLNGCPLAAHRRRELGRRLQIGDANAKQFVRRLNALHISREEVERTT
jgi:ribonuclease M5